VFEYFPHNYPWNLAVLIALNSGGVIDEVHRACSPLLPGSGNGSPDTDRLFDCWASVANRLIELAEEDEASGRDYSASQKYARAACYLAGAERLQPPEWSRRGEAYARVLDIFTRGATLSSDPFEKVEVPWGDTSMPAYLISVGSPSEPAACMIQWNGLDSTKEMMHQSGLYRELARRGVSTLIVDTPGSGEALRCRGLTARPDTEVWASACVDYLEERHDIASDRIGIVGWSLGGYYAPRAAAFEKRLKLCVAWGANHNWGALQRRRLRNEGEKPVTHYWEHVQWVWGADDEEDFLARVEAVSLVGVVSEITVPFLITHGQNDRQIPRGDADQSYAEAIGSPKRELKIFSEREGGVEHVSIDNLPLATSYIADWVSETLNPRFVKRELRADAREPAAHQILEPGRSAS
jgi:dienelactone hydrolase